MLVFYSILVVVCRMVALQVIHDTDNVSKSMSSRMFECEQNVDRILNKHVPSMRHRPDQDKSCVRVVRTTYHEYNRVSKRTHRT
jgi:hypothetical protein